MVAVKMLLSNLFLAWSVLMVLVAASRIHHWIWAKVTFPMSVPERHRPSLMGNFGWRTLSQPYQNCSTVLVSKPLPPKRPSFALSFARVRPAWWSDDSPSSFSLTWEHLSSCVSCFTNFSVASVFQRIWADSEPIPYFWTFKLFQVFCICFQ